MEKKKLLVWKTKFLVSVSFIVSHPRANGILEDPLLSTKDVI